MSRTFHLVMDCDNAAFEDAHLEIARCLREAADYIQAGSDCSYYRSIRDFNGNIVGRYAIKGGRP